MIESRQEASKDLEKALQALEQAKQRVANEKRKQSEKRRKAENHHKYIMGGIIVKYFPDCYSYDEGELNRILSVALQTKECQQIIAKIKSESREPHPNNLRLLMPKMKAGRYGMTKETELKNRCNVSTPFTGCAQIYHQRWYVRPAEGVVCLATAKWGKGQQTVLTIPLCKLCLLPCRQDVGVAYG